MLGAHLGSWAFRNRLGLLQPMANLNYFTYSDRPGVDRCLYFIFYPCYRLASPGAIHARDRKDPGPRDGGP